MTNRGNAVLLSAISDALRSIKKNKGLSNNFMADSLQISQRSFETYIQGKSVPTVENLVKICNYFKYSINDILQPLIAESTDQIYLEQIHSTLQQYPDFRRNQICYIFEPIITAISLDAASFPKDYRTKIRILRTDNGLTFRHLAEILNLAPNSLKQIESCQSNPGILTLCEICNALRVSPEYLLADSLTYLSSQDASLYSLLPRHMKALADAIKRQGYAGCITL